MNVLDPLPPASALVLLAKIQFPHIHVYFVSVRNIGGLALLVCVFISYSSVRLTRAPLGRVGRERDRARKRETETKRPTERTKTPSKRKSVIVVGRFGPIHPGQTRL